MAAISSKGFVSHQERRNGMAVNGQVHTKADMLGCDPANTYATRPIAVLEGDAAIEFYERWQKLLEKPKKPLSEEDRKEREEWKKYFKEQRLRELYERSKD